VVHVYMTTTGYTIFAHIRAMITGWEQVADEESVGDWEYKTKAA
jgi:thiosulfate reductase cytochrome b subunit